MSTQVSQVRTVAELLDLCNRIGVEVNATPMYRKDFVNVRFEPHLSTMWLEYSPSLEKKAVRTALKELAFEGLIPLEK
jgi:uncharacterized protein YqkB